MHVAAMESWAECNGMSHRQSIPHVIEKVTDFSKIPGYKMNVNKTELFPINNFDKLNNYQQFKIKSKNIKYLGCLISKEKTQLYKDNYIPLIKGLK